MLLLGLFMLWLLLCSLQTENPIYNFLWCYVEWHLLNIYINNTFKMSKDYFTLCKKNILFIT